MEDSRHHYGCAPFSAIVTKKDGKAYLGFLVEVIVKPVKFGDQTIGKKRSEFMWLLGGKFVPTSPEKALKALCDNWEAISGPYAGFDDGPAEVDFLELVDDCPVSGVFHRHGAVISFKGEFGTAKARGNSPIVIEVLLAVGNDLAPDASPELAERWAALADRTLLPPMPVEDYENDDPGRERFETAFYAKAVGQDEDEYRRAAMWINARQFAFAVGEPGYVDTSPEERDPRHLPDGIPSEAEIDAVYALSIDKIGVTLEQAKRDAVYDRNHHARQFVVFRKFFPLPSDDVESAVASPSP